MRSRGKRRQMRTLVLGAGLVCLIQLAPLLALGANQEHRKVWNIELGLAAWVGPELEGSKDYTAFPYPVVAVGGANVPAELVALRLP